MSSPRIDSWRPAESPVAIEYSLVLVEEIRNVVADGFQRLSRGGLEVGGILYGDRDGDTIRLHAMREIRCEHARGPSFVLSEADRAALTEQLIADQQDPKLQGMVCVGWFLSHTRTEINLSDADLDVYSSFFPEPWQVALVVHPGRNASMRAGFFVREGDGTVKTGQSYLEFNFPDRAPGSSDRAPTRERRPFPDRTPISDGSPSPALANPEPIPVPLFSSGSSRSVPMFGETAPPRRKWPWLVGWLVLATILIALGVRYFTPPSLPAAEPLGLLVLEREGQLQIEWNRLAKPVNTATRGTLEIVDGSERRSFDLTPQMLTKGNFVYLRTSGEVEIRMTVEGAAGAKQEEASRFLGKPPAVQPTGELEELKTRRAELEAEVKRLRQENEDQVQRIQQLDRTLRILQTRLGIDQGKQ